MFNKLRSITSAFTIATITILTPMSALATSTFNDNFNTYPDGLITSEFTHWNPTSPYAKKNVNWEMTSGALFSSTLNGEKVAYSGYPTYESSIGPSPTTTNGTNSSVFRLTTVPSNFGNAEVSFRLYDKQFVSTSGTPAVAWDGVHVFLRYQSEESLYYASVNRRDGAVVIKKKVPGGPSNGGTYYTLASTSSGKYPVPLNTWQDIKATIKTNADNTVTIQLFRNGALMLSSTDNGSVGGAPILSPGKSGIRGDNTEFYFDNFNVDDMTTTTTTPPPTETTPPPAPSDTTSPTVSISSPTGGTTLSGTRTLSANAADNVALSKVEFYDGTTLVGTGTSAPYSVNWDTTKTINSSHSLTAKAYDTSQNVATSSPVAVTVYNAPVSTADTTAPLVTISSPTNGAVISRSVSIKANATDNVKAVKMQVYIDGVLRTTNTGDKIYTVQSLNGSGYHTIKINSIDAAGNVGSSSVTVRKL